MIARLLAAAALLLPAAVPVHAANGEADWAGVYRGTIGKSRIIACLDGWGGDGAGRGSYYYLRHLKPITLSSDAPPGLWLERAPGAEWNDTSGPQWTITNPREGELAGKWRHGERSLPLRLERIATAGEADGMPCASPAFMGPRVRPAEFSEVPQALGGFAYTRLEYRVPEHFADVAIAGFRYAPTRPGDGAINLLLAADLPRGRADDDFLECLGGGLASHGVDGSYELLIAPHHVTGEFLDAAVTSGTYCGGAHPNYWIVHRVFDRATGEEIDLSLWFGINGFADGEYGGRSIADALRQLALRRWPAESDGECRDAAADQSFWQLSLEPAGIGFTPDLPHVYTACEETVTIPWSELEPFLSAAGHRALARLR
ncbi:MAG: hypothetical protein ACO25F_03735 [Erythrobacter sp.]